MSRGYPYNITDFVGEQSKKIENLERQLGEIGEEIDRRADAWEEAIATVKKAKANARAQNRFLELAKIVRIPRMKAVLRELKLEGRLSESEHRIFLDLLEGGKLVGEKVLFSLPTGEVVTKRSLIVLGKRQWDSIE